MSDCQIFQGNCVKIPHLWDPNASVCNYPSALQTQVMSQCRCQVVSAGSISRDSHPMAKSLKIPSCNRGASWDKSNHNASTIQRMLVDCGMRYFGSQRNIYKWWHFDIMSPLSITKLGWKTKNWLINSLTVDTALVTKPLWWNNMINQKVLLLVIEVNNVTKEYVFVTTLSILWCVPISISSHLIQLITHINSSNKTNLKMLIFH